MKLGSSLFTSSLALAAVALSVVAFTSAARADDLPSNGLSGTAPGDLILGFRNGNTATATSVLVNIGSVYNLLVAAQDAVASGTTSVYIGNFNEVLTAAYGSGWFASATYWTVTGIGADRPGPNNSVIRTAYAGQSWTTAGAHQLAKNTFVNQRSQGFSGKGASFPDYNPNIQGTTNNRYLTSTDIHSTDMGLSAVVIANYSYLGSNALGTGFANVSAAAGSTTSAQNLTYQEARFSSAYGNQLDLFEILPGPDGGGPTDPYTQATLLGWFTFDSAGGLSFTLNPSSVPEPATYAALFGGLSLAVAALRRSRA